MKQKGIERIYGKAIHKAGSIMFMIAGNLIFFTYDLSGAGVVGIFLMVYGFAYYVYLNQEQEGK